MKKLHHLLACSALFFSFVTLSLPAFAQAPVSGQFAGMIAAANTITQEAIGATSDANYVANHTSGGGNANQMTSRLNALGGTISRIATQVAYLQQSASTIALDGLQKEIAEISAGAQITSQALNTCLEFRAAGLPIPAGAALQLQDVLFALRDASPCIRREIQEIQ